MQPASAEVLRGCRAIRPLIQCFKNPFFCEDRSAQRRLQMVGWSYRTRRAGRPSLVPVSTSLIVSRTFSLLIGFCVRLFLLPLASGSDQSPFSGSVQFQSRATTLTFSRISGFGFSLVVLNASTWDFLDGDADPRWHEPVLGQLDYALLRLALDRGGRPRPFPAST